MTLRVVCDTNILISAVIADGPPSSLLGQAIEGRVELIVPDQVMVEVERVLREKLGFDEHRLTTAVDLTGSLSTPWSLVPQYPPPLTGDPADDLILACAVETRVDVLATGDKRHLLPVGEYEGVRILTPQALLAELHRAERD